MAHYDYEKGEVGLKIVYYGPGLGGKTTNLKFLHGNSGGPDGMKLHSIETANDRTLFFDFMPIDAPAVSGFKVRVHLYTVPGQVHYDNVRKVVLRGADAVVFVADSQKAMRKANLASLKNLFDNMSYNKIDPKVTPIVLQYNKRDLPDIDSVEELDRYLNKEKYQSFESSALTGVGVRETLRAIVKGVSAQAAVQIENMKQVAPRAAKKPAAPPSAAATVARAARAPRPAPAMAPPQAEQTRVDPPRMPQQEMPMMSAGVADERFDQMEQLLADILKRVRSVELLVTGVAAAVNKVLPKKPKPVAPTSGASAPSKPAAVSAKKQK